MAERKHYHYFVEGENEKNSGAGCRKIISVISPMMLRKLN